MPKYVDLAKGFARSLTADVMGGFGDTANNLENLARAGYGFVGSELGLLKPSQLPELREPKDALLTSDWLAKNTPLQDTGSGEYTTGRLASLAIPLLGGFASRARAPSQSTSLGPQSEALATAQRNAALPINQGGLGLSVNNTPMERAQAMGFDNNTPLYHSTNSPTDFPEFIPSPRGKLGAGVYTSPSAPYTEKYIGGENARIMPLVARGKFSDEDARIQIQDKILQELKDKNPNFSIQEWKDKTLEELKRQGYAGSDVDKERVIFDPKNLRSRFAAFDPFQKDSANILAGFGGLGVLSTLLPEESFSP